MAGGSDSAQQQAQAEQRAQDAANQQTVAQVRNLYNSPKRAQDIASFTGSLRDYYDQDLDRQKAINDRNLKFAMIRNGQLGGSTQVDQTSKLNQDYIKGLLLAQQKADSAGAQLQSQDQGAESSLIAQAQAGLDPMTAATQAAASMRTNLQASQANAKAQGLGDLFGDMSDVYAQSYQRQQERRADKKFNDLYNNLMGTPSAPAAAMPGSQ